MRAQQRLLLLYFGAVLTAFYSVYYYIVRGGRVSLTRYNVDDFVGKSPAPFVRRCQIFYEDSGQAAMRKMADALYRRLDAAGVSSEMLDLARYEHFGKVAGDAAIVESFNDMLDISGPFTVVLKYVAEPPFKGDFEMVVHGGKTLVFTLTSSAFGSLYTGRRIYDLTHSIVFSYEGMPSTNMTPLLDLNLVLTSDDCKIGWNVKEDVINPYFHPIANVMSLFYDISIHSRVVSGANLTGVMKLKGEHIVDLQEQDVEFFHFIERITTVEVPTRDSSIYRHSIAFVCHAPHKMLRFYDRALKRETESVMLKGLGVISLLDPAGDRSAGYELTGDDIRSLTASWVTYIRKLHNLPPSLTEMVADTMQGDEAITVVEDGHYVVESPRLTFSVRTHAPGLVAFYGFEVPKIATSLYNLYVKAAVDTLQKVVKPLSAISFMTRVSPAAANSVKVRATCRIDIEALALARTAFKQSLEAMGDDETYAKDFVSTEHGFASVMCDAFPFIFPLLANSVKYLLKT
ncbi:membrane protein, putative [Babesia bigemina]|uniref:Membrane protein, putative n=1 Tax=Babesia bigemina TaxID=5866 RepID=A0A061D854_BABBI|nr:membrane protein, putative [Babesia bigemina]CDR96172.1 membrane protein, putative [Babesia bigemina]|eukprot:XP_012768358.1 membrane protein, putative [Babesia bigemina]